MTNENNGCCRPYDEKINHIKCEVNECAYHDTEDCCHAELIKVKSCCDDGRDTVCATFRPEV